MRKDDDGIRETKRCKIAVITGTRADYGLLEPVIRRLSNSRKLKHVVYATGMHLSASRGMTIDDIKHRHKRVDMPMDVMTPSSTVKSLSVGMKRFASAFMVDRPDIVLTLGDRLEQLAAAQAAFFLGIPIAHIHGGDRSGGWDDAMRDMITRMATHHFTASERSAARVREISRSPHISVCGAPGLDSIVNIKKKGKMRLSREYKIPVSKEWCMVVFHPDTADQEISGLTMAGILMRLPDDMEKIVVYPNTDSGSGQIMDVIREINGYPGFHTFANIPRGDFISLLSRCSFIIGNSSCGIIEAPVMGIPAINIGGRQAGRERGFNVIDVDSVKDIPDAIAMISGERFVRRLKRKESPYGDGKASLRIVDALEGICYGGIRRD